MIFQGLKTSRYIFAGAILTIVMILHSLYGKWIGDFWEHSAVVRELATNPFDPRHPLLIVNQAHPFFSPYLLSVGLLTRLFSWNANTALATVGVLNLLLLLLSLWLFVHSFFIYHQDMISFLALMFILFLWPAQAWNWSGFFYFKTLGYVLPYPSSFALALTFLIFTIFHCSLRSLNVAGILATGLLTTTVLLTHVTTAVAAIIGIAAISFHHHQRHGVKAIVAGFLILIGAGLLALLWPYYSIFALLRANDSEFHSLSYTLYRRIYLILPSLMLLPFAMATLVSRFKKNRFDALLLMLLGSIGIIFFGFISGQYGFGRLISFMIIIIQISAAAWFAQVKIKRPESNLRYAPLAAIAIAAIFALNANNLSVLGRSFKGLRGLRYSYVDFEAMGWMIGQYDLVLSDLENGWMMPAFGGKIVASKHPAHWVDDHMQRREDVNNFFADRVETADKLAIVDKYDIDFVLFDRHQFKQAPECFFDSQPQFESDEHILFMVNDGSTSHSACP